MGKTPLPPKKDVALALLESSTVYVHLDPRAQGVTVPPWFKKQPQLVLQIGLNMPVPIPDLSLDGEGVSCTLSFNRSPQFCSVPWKAIYALVGEDGRGMVWPDDVPPEVAAQTRPSTTEPKQKRKKKSHLQAVGEGGARGKAGSTSRGRPVRRRGPNASVDPNAEPPPTAAERDADNHEGVADSQRESAPSSKRKLPPYLRVVK